MYIKPELAPLSREEVLDLIRAATFATIVSAGAEGLVASHYALVREHFEDVVLVSDEHIAEALKLLLD